MCCSEHTHFKSNHFNQASALPPCVEDCFLHWDVSEDSSDVIRLTKIIHGKSPGFESEFL